MKEWGALNQKPKDGHVCFGRKGLNQVCNASLVQWNLLCTGRAPMTPSLWARKGSEMPTRRGLHWFAIPQDECAHEIVEITHMAVFSESECF